MMIRTGIKIKEFEVLAEEPNRCRWYHTLYLSAGIVPLKIVETTFCAKPAYEVTFDLPDCKCSGVFGGYHSREEAEERFAANPTMEFMEQFEVWDGTEEFRQKNNPGVTGGVIWNNREYAGFDFSISGDVALEIIAWRKEADHVWFEAHPDFLPRERARNESQARAAAYNELPEIPRLLECWECGAIYSEPGHVEFGGMSCDRCK